MGTRKLLWCAALLVSLLAAQSTQAPALSDADKAKNQAKIQGKVVNLVAGEPVRKANLSLRGLAGGPALTATADNEGKFIIESIDPGRYILSADRQGFVKDAYGAKRSGAMGTVLELKAAQTMSDLVFKLTPQGVIAGHVLDDEGEPLAGVMVQALQYQYFSGKKRLIPTGNPLVQTNDLGEFRAPNLAPGRYYIGTSSQRLTDLTQAVTGEQAKNKEGFVPTFYPSAAEPSAATAVDVAPGAEIAGINLRMVKARVYRVSGKLMNAVTGAPMNNGMLMVYRREQGGMSTLPTSMHMVQNDKGTFDLKNIPPGPYLVMGMSTNPQDIMITMSTLDVGDKDVENMVITLGSGVDVTVTAKMENPPAKDVDLSGIRVTLRMDDNPMASLATTQLGKELKSVMKRVNPDKYDMTVAGLPANTYVKAAKYADQNVFESGIDVRPGAAATLELTIAAPSGDMSTVVRNEKGDPAAGAVVTLVPQDPKRRTDLFRNTTADQNGMARVTGIVPGEYLAYAWEDIENGAAEDPDFVKPFASRGVKVKFSEGSKESVTLTTISREAVDAEKAKH